MGGEPMFGTFCPSVAKVRQELPIGIELAHGTKLLQHVINFDRVNEDPLQTAVGDLSVVDQLGHEYNGAHLAKERRVEADLIDAVDDLLRGLRYRRSFARIDVNDDDIGCL